MNCSSSRRDASRPLVDEDRQREPELGAAGRPRPGPDAAAHRLDEGAADEQLVQVVLATLRRLVGRGGVNERPQRGQVHAGTEGAVAGAGDDHAPRVRVLLGCDEGGLTASFSEIRSVLGSALSLAFIGTLITAMIAGLAAWWIFDLSLLEGLLLGSG